MMVMKRMDGSTVAVFRHEDRGERMEEYERSFGWLFDEPVEMAAEVSLEVMDES